MVLFSQYINLENNFSLISTCPNINVTDFCRFKFCDVYLQVNLLNCFSKVTFFSKLRKCVKVYTHSVGKILKYCYQSFSFSVDCCILVQWKEIISIFYILFCRNGCDWYFSRHCLIRYLALATQKKF